MRGSWSRREVLRGLGVGTVLGMTGCAETWSGPSPNERVAEHENSLQRLSDLRTALQEGYRTSGKYVHTADGVLGIPFVNPRVESLDPNQPTVVLFGLDGNGQYQPYGLKWFVRADSVQNRPSLFGQEFVGPRPGETTLIPEHYALHVWLFRENPAGLFALYNPGVSPPTLVDRIKPVRAALASLILGSQARDKGYTNTETCVMTPQGLYGIPFVKSTEERLGGLDKNEPPLLLYRLRANWTYQLMGAEWYVPRDQRSAPPTMFGKRFHEPMAGHSEKTNQPDHYGLHAWFFRANPRGMFAPFHPMGGC